MVSLLKGSSEENISVRNQRFCTDVLQEERGVCVPFHKGKGPMGACAGAHLNSSIQWSARATCGWKLSNFFPVKSDNIMTFRGQKLCGENQLVTTSSGNWWGFVCMLKCRGAKNQLEQNQKVLLCCFDVLSHDRKTKSSLSIMSSSHWDSSSSIFPPQGSSGLCPQPCMHDLHNAEKQMRPLC